MYQSPKVTRLGSLRELTKAGANGPDDGLFSFIDGNLVCDITGNNCS
jgi:hypothetical protein